MRALKLHIVLPILLVLGALIVAAVPASARTTTQDDDLVERGRYLVTIAGCIECHTPINLETFQPIEGMEFAGGNAFEVPGLGTILSRNITQDEEYGIGAWTDEEIKTTIQTGVAPDGQHIFPIMPYTTFNNMAEEDLDAIVAFLRTVEPINNPIPRQQLLPDEAYPQLQRRTDIVAPDPTDTAERGRYLMRAVTACTDCHTPIDAETGAPIMDMYLAGGQPYAGPWGTIYGGNITPDEETGIGTWSDEDIERVVRQGIRPDGRIAVLMPYTLYSQLTDDDMAGIIYFLRNDVQAVHNEVPAAALNPGFEHFVGEQPPEEATAETQEPQVTEEPAATEAPEEVAEAQPTESVEQTEAPAPSEETGEAGQEAAEPVEQATPGVSPVLIGAGAVIAGVVIVALLLMRRNRGAGTPTG